MAVSLRLEIAKRQIESAREYLMTMLDGLSEDDWFWVPEQGIKTHIAWQVGHLAMAQYGLTLFRQRGRESIDTKLMTGKFRKLFMKGTTPMLDRETHPSSEVILETLERVNGQMLEEIDSFDGDFLDEPLGPPHAAYATKYGALLFASHHEMLHAGQIGLLRRSMGKEPVR